MSDRDGYRDLVAVFDPDCASTHPLDYRLAVAGPVVLYWSTAVLARHEAWLAEQGYRVTDLDSSLWRDQAGMHDGLAGALDFPAYYGRNLDALRDCLSDVAGGDYGWNGTDTGLALVLRRFDAFFSREPHAASSVLAAFTEAARIASLFGNRLLCLVQSNDPVIALGPVAAARVERNDEERLDSRRQP